MNRTSTVCSLVGAIFMSGCAPQHSVHPVKVELDKHTGRYKVSESVNAHGVFYSLPRTVLRVEVPITLTQYQAGPYFMFAEANELAIPKGLKDKFESNPAAPRLEEARTKLLAYYTFNSKDGGTWADNLHAKLELQESELRMLTQQKQQRIATQPAEYKREVTDAQARIDALMQEWQRIAGALPTDAEIEGWYNWSVKQGAKTRKFALGAPSFASWPEPDAKQVFLIEISSGWLEDRELLLELTELGLLTVGDSHARDRTVDFVVATAKAVGKTVAAGLGASVTAGGSAKTVAKPVPTPISIRNRADEAKKIADTIHEVRKQRRELAALARDGQRPLAPLPLNTLDRMLTELTRIEESLLASFYSKSVKAGKVTYDHDPRDEAGCPPTKLFAFDEKAGLSEHRVGNEPVVYVPEAFRAPVVGGRDVLFTIDRDPKDQFADIAAQARAGWEPDQRGFHYRIPATATVSVLATDQRGTPRPLGAARMPIAQYGTVHFLPAGMNSIDSRLIAHLYESTGAIKKVEVKTKSLDPASVEKLGDVAAQIAGAVAARQAAKSDGESRIAKFNQRLQELQGLMKTAASMGVPIPPELLGSTLSADDDGEEDGEEESDGDGDEE